MDLWRRKRPLHQLSHIHCPLSFFLILKHCHRSFVKTFSITFLPTWETSFFFIVVVLYADQLTLNYFKSGPSPSSFSFIFAFSNNITIFATKWMWKKVHPVYGAGIRNLQPLEHESPPLTTRPRLPLINVKLLFCKNYQIRDPKPGSLESDVATLQKVALLLPFVSSFLAYCTCSMQTLCIE